MATQKKVPTKRKRNKMYKIVISAVSAVAIATSLGVVIPNQIAMHRSCGYHCSLNDSIPTPPVSQTIQIHPVRANIHSGGRLHGSANKRVGCGGCNGHPAAYVTTDGEIELVGRTNIHSDGRAAGKAMPRVGSPVGRGIGGHAIHKI